MKYNSNETVSTALLYFEKGYCPIPVYPRAKNPIGNDWTNQKLSKEDIEANFKEDVNIGVLLGKPSRGLVDVDIDSDVALHFASDLLPKTDSIFGRASRKRSHPAFTG